MIKPVKILTYPNVKLRRKSSNVRPEVNLIEVKQMSEIMLKTMKFREGIGLSAPQVGIALRFVVVNVPEYENLVLINPVILSSIGKQESEEGCLSFPGIRGTVERPSQLDIEYLDENGEKKRLIAKNLLARVISHEIEHLDGILFLDKVSPLRRDMVIRRYKKIGRINI